jgi:uncharacterized protein YgiM (DUF1202 family)
MKNQVYLVLLAALAGCASHTEVVALGSGRYMVGYQEKSKFDSWTEIKAITVKDASDYCEKQNLAVDVLDIKTHGVRGWTPQGAEVTFRCIQKSVAPAT